MDPDGSHQVRLTQDAHNEGSAVLSPDGKSIAYHEDTTNSGCYELFVMNADGTNPRQLTPDGDCNWGPSWTHDGSGLLFGTTRDGNFDIYTMRTDLTSADAPDQQRSDERRVSHALPRRDEDRVHELGRGPGQQIGRGLRHERRRDGPDSDSRTTDSRTPIQPGRRTASSSRSRAIETATSRSTR